MDWTLSQIRSEIRTLTGLLSTAQMSNDDIDERTNDFYRNRLPDEIDDKKLNQWYSKTLYATDSGDYDVSDEILRFIGNPADNPAFIDEERITIYQQSSPFFVEYPLIDTGSAYWITAPSMAIGVSNTAAVKNSAFTYRTSGSDYTYDKAAAETALSGDTVPQNKYGAWRLEINSSGTISIVEADDNATGYDTAAQAIAGLSDESGDNACMGFVTVKNTSGTFIPGTTTLNAAGVTATYTDGYHSTRNRPEAVLLEDDYFYVRPKPNDTYVFKAYCKIKPAELSGDSSYPLNPEWGPLIAGGTSLEIVDRSDTERIDSIMAYYSKYKSLINQRYWSQFFSGNQRAQSSF